jgi:hypothetical protein
LHQLQSRAILLDVINWLFYPKSDAAPLIALTVVAAFESVTAAIDSTQHELPSNGVLLHVAPHLARAGFSVETSKKAADCIRVPVLFGINGKLEKSFRADAHHVTEGMVVEVEAGRAVVNNQFLKDLFQACMMHGVHYLAIAVRNAYRGADDFDGVCRFFNTLYASNRLQLPLKGILIIGY